MATKKDTVSIGDDLLNYSDPDSWPELSVGERLGREAFRKAESKYRSDMGMKKSSEQSAKVGNKAWDEAQDEARRESTRGLPGPVKPMKKGGSVSSASKRADGCAQRGKTKGKIV